MDQNPMELFFAEAPGVARAFDNLVDAIRKEEWLDKKTAQLINISIQTANRNPRGVYFHAGMARDNGARREEVVGAVVMNLHLSGLAAVLECLSPALKGFEGE
ncbi:MAG TPA: carboxymuconolactone decarboxylase family protein [Methanolinea sp.]|nr:carboxymuconolactone decarboxylase family protein [Methanolinea sp.]HQK55983.1 carboxymuconolactone decarboxylase family protein [Methanolinea sp.]